MRASFQVYFRRGGIVLAADNKDRNDEVVRDLHGLFAPSSTTTRSDTDTQDAQHTNDTQHFQDSHDIQRANLVGPPDSGCSFKDHSTATKKSTPRWDDYDSIREIAASPLHIFEKLDWIYNAYYPWTVDKFPITVMWRLAHNSRALPELIGLKPKQAWEVVDAWREARQRLWDEHFGAKTDDDAQAEFMDLWTRIKRAAGENSLTDAVELADLAPIKLREEQEESKLYCKIMSVAFHLQHSRRGDNIFLSCHKLAKLLGCSHDTVARCLKRGAGKGLLQLRHPAAKDRTKAAEYTFALERFDENGVEFPVKSGDEPSKGSPPSPLTGCSKAVLAGDQGRRVSHGNFQTRSRLLVPLRVQRRTHSTVNQARKSAYRSPDRGGIQDEACEGRGWHPRTKASSAVQ